MERPPDNLTVRYSWRVRLFYGFIGINNLFWGILTSMSESWSNWIGYGFLLLGGICLAAAVWIWHTPYLSIQGEILIQPGWKTKRIPLQNLDSVRNFAGDLILESGTTKITLNKYAAKKEDVKALKEYLIRVIQSADTIPE